MSVVKEVIDGLQGFLTPKLGEVSGQLEGISRRLDSMDKRFDSVEKRQDRDYIALLQAIESAKNEIMLNLKLRS